MRLSILAFIFASLFTVAGCDYNEGGPEEVGENMEEAYDDVADSTEDAYEDVADSSEDMYDETKNSVEDACENMKDKMGAEDTDC